MSRVSGVHEKKRDARLCQVTRIVFLVALSAEDDDSLIEFCGRERQQVEAGGPINKFAVPTSGNFSACLISLVSPA